MVEWMDLIGPVFTEKITNQITFIEQPDKFLLNQLCKPLIYHNYKVQDINF